jgi:hypothetical protein
MDNKPYGQNFAEIGIFFKVPGDLFSHEKKTCFLFVFVLANKQK